MARNKSLDLTQHFTQPGVGSAFETSSLIGSSAQGKFEDLRKSLLTIDSSLDLNKIIRSDQANLVDFFKLAERRAKLNQAISSAFGSAHSTPFVFSLQNLGIGFPGPARFYNRSKNTTISEKVQERFVFTVPPAEFSVAVPGEAKTINTISGLQYTHAGNIELDEISFEGFLPFVTTHRGNGMANPYPEYIPEYVGTTYKYRTPSRWVRELVTAFRANQPLRFCVFAANDQSEQRGLLTDEAVIIAPMAVTVSAFDWGMGGIGGNRKDIRYSITLKRWRRQNICIGNYIKPPNESGRNPENGNDRGERPPTKKYTVKKGDTLLKIAQKLLGDGRRRQEIYEMNKPELNKQLKKRGQRINNPNLIYPGTVLVIPRK